MAIFAYGRAGANGQPIEIQRSEFGRAGYKIDHWYADEGISGSIPVSQRPQFARMLQQIRDGETLVVGKLDCLGCDAQDVSSSIEALAARRIAVIVLQLGNLDLASAAGKPMLAMLAAIVDMERDLQAERTQPGHGHAKAQGKQAGRLSSTTAEQRTEIITEYSRGYSVSELARRYNLSRFGILAIVTPRQRPEAEPLPIGWGD